MSKKEMSKKLVAAQIGCGSFATNQHGPNQVHNPHVGRIKWALDTNDENARQFAEKFGVEKIAESLEQITTDPEVDYISIATSHEAHVPIIESAAANGKHVFCEKPMAMNEAQSYKIIRAVRRGGIKLCVDYMRRQAPAMQALKREWLNHKNNPKRQPWRFVYTPHETLIEESVTDFIVRVQDESASYRMVHLDAFRGGGLIIGEAAHWLDLSCWLFDNDRPVEVRAWGSARMRYGIYMAFQSGNAATITFTPNGTFDYPKEMFEIAHNGALFRMEHWLENQYFGRPGTERETFELSRNPLPEVGKQGGLAGYLAKHKARVKKLTDDNQPTDMLANHGWEEMFDAFIDSVVNDTPTPCDEMAGYRATYLSELAMQSIKLNVPLPVEVDKWDYYVEL